MQEGLFFLWVLSVAVSVAALFYLEISFSVRGGVSNRRQMTGCELARQFLDRNQFHQTSVVPVHRVWRVHFGFDIERLFLGERAYYGTHLADLATAFHEAAHLLKESKSGLLPVNLRTQGSTLLRTAILVSWGLIFWGFLFRAWSWTVPVGEFVFTVICFRALALLGEEWEIAGQAITNLAQIEGLETGERVRIKELLKTLRWSPLAEIFAEPFSILFRHQRNIPAGVQ